MGSDEATDEALREWMPRLRALSARDITLVHADPRAAAVTGLLVADRAEQPDLAARLRALDGVSGFSSERPREVRGLGRVILALLDRLGGEFLPADKPLDRLVERAVALRATMMDNLERALPGSVDVRLWLDAVRRGRGGVDLIYDLRTLADLYGQHAETLERRRPQDSSSEKMQSARTAADEIERAARTGESADHRAARDSIVLAWTPFVRAYEDLCEAGRFAARGHERAQSFPPLAMIAAHRRAKRQPTSLVPPVSRRAVDVPPLPAPAVALAPPPLPQSVGAVESTKAPEALVLEESDLEPAASRAPAAPPKIPSRDDVPRVLEVPAPAPQPIASPLPPPATPREIAPAPPASADGDIRRASRHHVEIEVGFFSESNFYVGFTENISEGGLFVATYCAKPIGSHVEIDLQLPSGAHVKIEGIVRWLRMSSCDGWPGMGVQFTNLGAEDQSFIREFVGARAPIFYADD